MVAAIPQSASFRLLPIHQHVGGLEIAMHNLMLMRVLERVAHQAHEGPQVFPCKQMAGCCKRSEARSCPSTYSNVTKAGSPLRLHQLVNANDVWVGQVAALLHFTSEIIQGCRITGQFRGVV